MRLLYASRSSFGGIKISADERADNIAVNAQQSNFIMKANMNPDLGPYCLQNMLTKNQQMRERADDNCRKMAGK